MLLMLYRKQKRLVNTFIKNTTSPLICRAGRVLCWFGLVDADKCPAATVIVAAQMKGAVAVAHGQDLSHFFTALDRGAQAVIDELDHAAFELHAAWNGA